MALRALAFIVDGKPGIPIQLEELATPFDHTVVTNPDGYTIFGGSPQGAPWVGPPVPDPWNANIHIHLAGFAPYDYVLGSVIPGGIPSGNRNLFIGRPNHPLSASDVLLPPLVPLTLPRIVAGRYDFLVADTGEQHAVVGSTELMLAWRYDLEGADAIRPVLQQRRDLRINNVRALWQKGPGSNGLTEPWLMPTSKMPGFLNLLAEYQLYCEGCILADCRFFGGADWQRERVAQVRAATAGISNHAEQLGNEYQKNDFDPRNFSKPIDRLSTNASAITGGADALPYWDYFTFSAERSPAQKAIREYGPVEFLYGDRNTWGGLPALVGEGFKPGIDSSDPADYERAGAQARSASRAGRIHTDAGTAGNCRLFNSLELTCVRAFVKGLIG